jgi:hypothetical protein
MKSKSSGAIFNPWASIRVMMGFSRKQQRSVVGMHSKSAAKAAT